MYPQLALLALASSISTAMAGNLSPLQARQDVSTSASLTISFTLTPTPTETDAAVSSAYAAYSQACGSPIAQALQDGLAEYNANFPGETPITNVSDPDFVAFLVENGEYSAANSICQQTVVNLFVAEGNADSGDAGSTSSIASSSGSKSGGSATGSAAGKSTGPISTAGAPSSTPSPNGELAKTLSSQLFLLMLGIWGLRCAILN